VKKVFILLILMVFISPAYAATIYKWVDKDGVVNYTMNTIKFLLFTVAELRYWSFSQKGDLPYKPHGRLQGSKKKSGRHLRSR